MISSISRLFFHVLHAIIHLVKDAVKPILCDIVYIGYSMTYVRARTADRN